MAAAAPDSGMPASRSVADIDADEDEPEFVDGADGYALETIMHSGDGHAVTYDDLIMLPGFIDFGVADVRCVVAAPIHWGSAKGNNGCASANVLARRLLLLVVVVVVAVVFVPEEE